MKCLNPETLNRYRGGELRAPDEMVEVERHLAECAACRALLRSELVRSGPRLAKALLPAAEDFECLNDEQMKRYVDAETDAIERQWMEEHLADCARCREDVDSLRQFREEMRGFDWSKIRATSRRERLEDNWRIGLGWLEEWAGRLRVRLSGYSLWTRLLVALTLGLGAGLLMGPKAALFQPVAESIIKLLTVVATPLIFFAILHALLRPQVQWQVFRRLIWLLITNTGIAMLIGLSVASLCQPGFGARLPALSAPAAPPPALLSLFAPLLQNNLLYVIALALGLGAALRDTRQEERQAGTAAYRAVEDGIETAYRCLMRLLQWVILLLPLAVFASAAHLVGAYGRKPFQSLGGFLLTVLLALGLQAGYYLLRLRLGSPLAPGRVLRETRSVLLAAFWTASSAATMPLTYARVRERLQISDESASLGILVGGNINRDGTALFEVMCALFITQAMGFHPGFGSLMILLFMAALASVCAPGIPEAGLVTMSLVFDALRLPLEYIPMLLVVDWFLDRCRTAVNVLGHITVACLLDGKLPPVVPLRRGRGQNGAETE